jgi:hypothetical protein
MSTPIRAKRGIAGIILAFALVLFAVPAALAAPVNLETVKPFVVLGGEEVTNTGPSVLNGELGVSPGTSLTGFALPAVVNGAIHNNDAVAAQAQSDLTNAYNTAAGQASPPGNDLTGTDLGNRTLAPGTYKYTSDALLNGALTLDAAGDPNAEFVFQITSALTTGSASSVSLINGASPCNVYWQVGSSADLGTTTAFQGNLMALASISLKNGATVNGRMLARTGGVTLINNVLTAPQCATGGPETPPGPGTPPGTGTPGGSTVPGGTATVPGTAGPVGKSTTGRAISGPGTRNGKRTRNGRAVARSMPREACTSGFRASVVGRKIKRVVFSVDGTTIGARNGSPFAMSMRAAPGAHQVRMFVTFTDATHAKRMSLPYRACASALLTPPSAPSTFTG